MLLQKNMKKGDGEGPTDLAQADSEYFEQLDREITFNGARSSLRELLDRYGLTAEQLDETLQDIKKNQITYTFSKTQSIGGTMHQIMVELYKRAKVEHASWIRERRRAAMVPKLKQITNHTNGVTINPYLDRMQECIKFIDEIEDSKKGNKKDKNISTYDKFKLAISYMEMLEEPEKFEFMQRFIVSTKNNKVLELKPSEAEKWKALQRRGKEVNRKIEENKQNR